MNDNQNFLLRDGHGSQQDDPASGMDHERDRHAEMAGNPPGEQMVETSCKFGARTYVSSRGYFFQ